MRRIARTLLPAAGLVAAAATAAQAQFTVYALTSGGSGAQQLVSFNTASPNAVTTLGLTGAGLFGLDFRPANTGLYAYDGNLLYRVNTASGAATSIADIANTTGAAAGVDFNPAADRLRITDGSGNNYRVNVDAPGATATTVDGNLSYASGDANAGRVPNLTEVAYTNNDNDPATGTSLYGVDATSGTLALSSNPNAGTYGTVGSLGLGTNLTVTGFDVVTVGGTNMAFLSVLTAPAVSSLFGVNLMTGATTRLGDIAVAGGIRGFAVVPAVSAVPEPSTLGLLAGGVTLLGAFARRRRRSA